jgi:hypothetical protein
MQGDAAGRCRPQRRQPVGKGGQSIIGDGDEKDPGAGHGAPCIRGRQGATGGRKSRDPPRHAVGGKGMA